MQSLIVAQRVIAQVVKDKRTIGMMLVAPLFVLFLLYTILGSSSEDVTIGIVGIPEEMTELLEKEATVLTYSSTKDAKEAMIDQKINASISFENEKVNILVEGGNVSKNAAAIRTIQRTLTTLSLEQSKIQLTSLNKIVGQLQKELSLVTGQLPKQMTIPTTHSNKPEVDFLYGDSDSELFDQLAPALMGFFIFLFVFIIAGVSFLKERSSGTLERTLATPLKRSAIVLGYFLGFFLFVTIQTILIQLFIVNVLGVTQNGNYGLLLLVNLLTASVALSLGLLLSSYSRSEFQLIQFIPLAIIPQIFFSGMFDLTDAPSWVEFINKMMPLTYVAEALQNVMTRGYTIVDIWQNLLILSGFIIVFFLLNMRVLKKQRPV
ncbi:MAG: ABC transporter permease [Paenisporosarcina sp.]